MGRFLALILTCLISLSLTAGTAARAAEPIRCVGSDAAAHLGYVDDVREQVPSEDDKAAAHHHGSCQGEQVGEPEKVGFATQVHLRTAPPLRTNAKARVSSAHAPQGRSSVVSGQGVSVRVDIGGRRTIQKKNKIIHSIVLSIQQKIKR